MSASTGSTRSPTSPTAPGFEVALAAIGAALLVLSGVVWGGATLAAAVSGGRVSAGVGDSMRAAGRLASEPGDPQAAWGEHATGLPGPVVYWSCTAIVLVAAAAVCTSIAWGWRRLRAPSRTRFGVEVDAQIARPKDVRPLVVESTVPPSGRMLLGRMAGNGPMLATEDRGRHPLRRRQSARQGDRGSVALIGPTRSGKTVLASAGIVGWDGPVVALSVKRDLYDATAAARAAKGELAVFDPGGVTGLATARWTPLRDVTTSSGALRAGRALAQAIPRNGVTGGDFWASHGETLTSAYMCLAGLSQLLADASGKRPAPLTIGRLASWAFGHVGATDPTANNLIRRGVANHQPLETRLLARDALTKLVAFDQEDPRIRASIYATARLAFQSWTEPSVAHSASLDPRAHYWSDEIWEHEPRYIDLDWLMGGPEGTANTLYLSAPSTEFGRLAPVLGGLLGDLHEQIHAGDIAGNGLEKPLLILIDEAGQLELQWLPEEVSTIAGLGGLFVTCWQSRSQITHRYGTLADAVLGGHRSKVFFAGTDDPSTTDYVAKVSGLVHVPHRGWSADSWGGRKTISEHDQREDLLPPHVLRQMLPQSAVLIHGTLPPVHLELIRWWEDQQLRSLVPTDANGDPSPPKDASTCPVSEQTPTGVEPVIDPNALGESLRQLPPPKQRVRDGLGGPAGNAGGRVRPVAPGQSPLPFDEPAEGVIKNRVAGRCEKCGIRVEQGAGQIVRQGERHVLVCRPKCPTGATGNRHVRRST